MNLYWLGFSLIVCSIVDGRVWEETINNITINVQLKSGQITLSNDHNAVQINFGKIIEIGYDGETQVGISGFLIEDSFYFILTIIYVILARRPGVARHAKARACLKMTIDTHFP